MSPLTYGQIEKYIKIILPIEQIRSLEKGGKDRENEIIWRKYFFRENGGRENKEGIKIEKI